MLKWIAILVNAALAITLIIGFLSQFGTRLHRAGFNDWSFLAVGATYLTLNIAALYRTSGGRIGRLISLWVSAKEAELRDRADRKATTEA